MIRTTITGHILTTVNSKEVAQSQYLALSTLAINQDCKTQALGLGEEPLLSLRAEEEEEEMNFLSKLSTERATLSAGS